MKKIGFIILITTAGLFACKSPSQAMGADKIEPSNSSKKTLKETPKADLVYDVILSFISKGAGIDRDLKSKIDGILSTFNEKNNINLKPEIVTWGREGEVDYNFIVKNLSTSQKKELATQVQEAIGSSDMVQISYNKKSVHKR